MDNYQQLPPFGRRSCKKDALGKMSDPFPYREILSLTEKFCPWGGRGWATVTLGTLAKGVPYKQVDQTSLLFSIGSMDQQSHTQQRFPTWLPRGSIFHGPRDHAASREPVRTGHRANGLDGGCSLSLVNHGSSGLIWCIYLNSGFRFV